MFGFHVPHAPPVVTDAYVVDPLIATATTDANRFDTHIAAVSVGRSTLESHVDMTALKMDKATDPDGLARLLARMDRVEPFDMTPAEEADIEAWRQQVREYTLANQDSATEGIFE